MANKTMNEKDKNQLAAGIFYATTSDCKCAGCILLRSIQEKI